MVLKMKKIKSIAGICRNKCFYAMHDLDENDDEIRKLKNSYKDKRCFLIGSGPSINKTNLKLLDNEIKVGLNLIYKTGMKFQLYFVVGNKIPKNNTNDLLDLTDETQLFLGCSAGRWWLKNMEHIFPPYILRDYGELHVWDNFPLDITKGVRGGHTVTSIALQTLLYLGFKEVYLLGHDCDYRTNGLYFNDNRDIGYDRDWDIIFKSYEVIRRIYERQGAKIYNSTIGGKLEVFERIDLNEVFK